MQIARTIAAEMQHGRSQRNDLRQDNSDRSHQRQTDKWLTRRTEQLHLLAVFAYRALAAQAAIVLCDAPGVGASACGEVDGDRPQDNGC